MSAFLAFTVGTLVGGMVFVAFFALLAITRVATRDRSFDKYMHRYYSAADIGRIHSEAAYQR